MASAWIVAPLVAEEAAHRRKPVRPRVLPACHGLRHRAEWIRVVAGSGSTRSGPRASFHGEMGRGRLGLQRRWWGRKPRIDPTAALHGMAEIYLARPESLWTT
jgi:hypothetical protein